jgi:hypothetical protein
VSDWRSRLPELPDEGKLYRRVVAQGQARREQRRHRVRVVAGVAAATLVLVGFVSLVANTDGGDENSSSSATTAAAATTAAGAATTGAPPTTAGSGSATTVAVPLVLDPMIVFEAVGAVSPCGPSTVAVSYRPGGPISAPTVTWRAGTSEGSAVVSVDGTVLRAEIGPFSPGTATGGDVPLVVTLTGLDASERPVTTTATAELRACPTG